MLIPNPTSQPKSSLNQEVTFRDFQQLMVKRKRTVDDLVDLFRGKLEDTRDFFERVMSCKYKGEDRGGVVIPYRSVIEFYGKELEYLKDSEAEERKRALIRKRGPVSQERRKDLCEQLAKARAAKIRDGEKSRGRSRDFIEEVT